MSKKINLIIVFVVVISLSLTARCFSVSNSDYLYKIPASINDGLKTESMYKAGIDPEKLINLVHNIKNNNYTNIHSLLILKDGKLILEEYFHGFNREKTHPIRSANKSIGSILTGIAIDKHFIKNTEEKIYPHFKDYEINQKWVEESTKEHTISDNHRKYGYLWWIGSHQFGNDIIKGYWAAGNGGNYIFVCPQLNLVAAFTGGNYSTPLEIQPLGMLINYIIPSILPPIPPPKTIKPDSKILDPCIGEYRQKSGHILISVFKKNKNLVCDILGKTSRIYPVKKDYFFVPDGVFGDWTFKLVRNEKNRVISAIGYAAFQTIPFEKVK